MADDASTSWHSLPWPQKGDQLFKSDSDWWNNACVNFTYDQWEGYAQGYKLAADLLVEHGQDHRADIDFLVYPIVFLYRQHIELRLKQIIYDGYKLLDDDSELPKTHDLTQLWVKAREILKKVELGEPSETLDSVETCIKEFSKVDGNSQGFRYPITKDNKPSLPSDLSLINLRHLFEVVQGLATFLESACLAISLHLENKYEYLAEMQENWL